MTAAWRPQGLHDALTSINHDHLFLFQMETISDSLFLIRQEERDLLPALYSQDGKGTNAIIQVHLFGPIGDFYLTEIDEVGELAFGYSKLSSCPEGAELGYISIKELQEITNVFVKTKNIRYMIERDCYWTPCPLKEVMK